MQRGRVIRERLLCQDLPEVPADLDTNLAGPASFKNNRERYSEHSKNSNCAGCHRMMDPVGFALEKYDAFGRYRDTEGNMAVDATGTIFAAPDGTDVPLDGAESLTKYLVGNEAVRSCLVRYWSYMRTDAWTGSSGSATTTRFERKLPRATTPSPASWVASSTPPPSRLGSRTNSR